MKRSLFALLLLGCPPAPQPSPPLGEGGSCTPETACAHAAALGCSVGADPHCPDVMNHVLDAGLITLDLPCVCFASSKESMAACAGMAGSCQP